MVPPHGCTTVQRHANRFVQRSTSWRLHLWKQQPVRRDLRRGLESRFHTINVTAHGRNDEGVYYWFADIDEDNDGYNTTDQGDGDRVPVDGTQWDDTDDDGYGDNPAANEPDACPTTPGTSTEDRYGCPARMATVGPMKSWAVLDPSQWVDADEDGYGDNYLFDLDEYQYHVNQSGERYNDPAVEQLDGDGFNGDNCANDLEHLSPTRVAWVAPSTATQPTRCLPAGPNTAHGQRWRLVAATTPTATEPMRVQTLGVILNTIVWAARTPTATDAQSDGGWPSTSDCFGADAFPGDPRSEPMGLSRWVWQQPDGNQPASAPTGTALLR